MHTCTFVSPMSQFSLYILHHGLCKVCSTLRKELKHKQVSATALPSLRLPSSCPSSVLPVALHYALLLLCVFDTSWHVAKSPGHFSLLSYPLYCGADSSLVARRLLLQVCHFSRCLTVRDGASQPVPLC